MRLAVLLILLAILTGCGAAGGSSASTTPGTPMTPGGNPTQQDAIARLNAYRLEADVGPVALNDTLDVSATKHAGYQAIRAKNLVHYESVDGTDKGAPDSGNALFVAVDPFVRMDKAYGASFPNGYAEGISSMDGAGAIDHLWNTVYHRLPMMRHVADRAGFGDRATAAATYPGKGVPSGGWGYATIDFGANYGATVADSIWPKDGATGIGRSFRSDGEIPDPVAGVEYVGTPIHWIAPATSITAVTASVTPDGGSPTTIHLLTRANDGYLAGNEVFIMTHAPLAANTLYHVVIQAEMSSAPVARTWSFSTGP
jgi:hypothetical protein